MRSFLFFVFLMDAGGCLFLGAVLSDSSAAARTSSSVLHGCELHGAIWWDRHWNSHGDGGIVHHIRCFLLLIYSLWVSLFFRLLLTRILKILVWHHKRRKIVRWFVRWLDITRISLWSFSTCVSRWPNVVKRWQTGAVRGWHWDNSSFLPLLVLNYKLSMSSHPRNSIGCFKLSYCLFLQKKKNRKKNTKKA